MEKETHVLSVNIKVLTLNFQKKTFGHIIIYEPPEQFLISLIQYLDI